MGPRKLSIQPSRYVYLKQIGYGTSGKVFKVYDTLRADYFAIKEFRSDQTLSRELIEKYWNEYELMSELRHPGLVKAIEFGFDEKFPYIVMEWVDGKSLSELGSLSITQIVRILGQVAEGLAAIHAHQLIHRDVKPGNIKLSRDGHVKLLDFGSMTRIDALIQGKLSGTYAYMAPEAITGEVISEGVDLYSLGVIGYELLAGKRPFDGSKWDVLEGHLRRTPPPLTLFRSDLPKRLRDIIEMLLQKNPSHRYRTCSSLINDLQEISNVCQHLHSPVPGSIFGQSFACAAL